MHVMTPTQAAATAQAIREARTLTAYVQLLIRSSSITLPLEITNQTARLSAALHAMDATNENAPPATLQTPSPCRA